MDVKAHSSVSEFFCEAVAEALERRALQPSESTEYYLVDLLGEFTRARIPDEPLSLKLVAAAEPGERVKALKEVGDTTLYVAGFFAESLRRKLIDSEYYIGLGTAAYGELAQRLRGQSAASVIYSELAAQFPRFVDVLGEVSSQVQCASSDVVALYQQWLKTRSEWIERRLRALGVLVSSTLPGREKILH